VDSFNAMGHDKLKNVFLSRIALSRSWNAAAETITNFMGKEKMARQGLLPYNIACPLALYNSARKHLNTA
jgi:hypothetical protein